MNVRKKIATFMISSCLILSNVCSFPVSAVNIMPPNDPNSSTVQQVNNGVPNNNTPVYNGNNNQQSDEQIDAESIFKSSKFTGEDDTGYADAAGNTFAKFVKFVLNVCVYLFSGFFAIVFGVDCLIVAFPALATFFATKVPLQLFSNEAAEIVGITFSPDNGNGNGGSSGGMGGSNGGSGNGNGDNTILGRLKTYILNRGFIVIFTALLLALTYSGILGNLINLVVNKVAGLIVGAM